MSKFKSGKKIMGRLKLQEIVFSGLEISKFSRDKPPQASILRLQEIAFSALEISKFSRDKPPDRHPKIAGNYIFRP